MITPFKQKLALAIVTVLLVLAGPGAQAGGASPYAKPNPIRMETVPEITGRMIIRYRAQRNQVGGGDSLMKMREIAQRHGVDLAPLRRMATGEHVIQLNKDLTHVALERLAREIEADDADIESIEPDARMQAMFSPSDELVARQWHLGNQLGGIRLPAAWDLSTGAGVAVAVIDSGVLPHADLLPNLLPGYDFIRRNVRGQDGDGRDQSALDEGDGQRRGQCLFDPLRRADSSWHGTHVAGTVGAVANNGTGVAGVAFGAKILPVRALGRCGGYMSDIIDAITWASGGEVDGVPTNPNPARVLNLSLGGRGACSAAYQRAIDGARDRGAVVVVAAGNDGLDANRYQPASCRGVIVVGATLRDGSRAPYSNTGSLVDVYAPGGSVMQRQRDGILSTLNDGRLKPGADAYAYYNGTSMAAPQVAGVAALMLSRNPALSPTQVEALLKFTARPLGARCADCTAGLLDATAAVRAAAP